MTAARILFASVAGLSLFGAGCTGCSKKEAPAPEATAAGTAPVTTPAPPAIGARRGSVGIPECDEYLDKWEACIRRSTLPAAGAHQAFKAQRESFRIAAATPEGQATFKDKCRAMLDKLATDKLCAGGDQPGAASAAPGQAGGHPQTPGQAGGHPQAPGQAGGHPQAPAPGK